MIIRLKEQYFWSLTKILPKKFEVMNLTPQLMTRISRDSLFGFDLSRRLLKMGAANNGIDGCCVLKTVTAKRIYGLSADGVSDQKLKQKCCLF
ncbi:hypothetical protein NYE64_18350 [Bacillus sp. FSL L8-0173]|uniref:hypothetical protein n=1 Tax=Bacillus sp. FSL L8-0173 TaxID=2975296 RepID=UPI0030F9E230